MKPAKPSRKTDDLFRERLDVIFNREHALVLLGQLVPWADFDTSFGKFYKPIGRPAKRLYNAGALPRILIVVTHAPYLLAGRWLAQAVRGRIGPGRGISLWHDMLDWLGGWPFECAPAKSVVAYHEEKGFALLRQKLGRRHGCNEFVLKKLD